MKEKYLIVVPSDLSEEISALVAQKEARGYEVIIQHVENFGSPPDPDRIRDYILDNNPSFLLLVGDHDKTPGYPLEDTHTGSPKKYVSDAYFSMLPGDSVPNIPTGRLSTNDTYELREICDLLVSYPKDSDPTWRRRAILTGWIPRARETMSGDDAGWRCLREIGPFYDVTMEFEHNHLSSDVAKNVWDVRDSSKETLAQAINNGAAIVRYLGHGTPDAWHNIGVKDRPSIDELFQIDDVNALEVGDKTPLVISATCLTGQVRQSPAFAEAWQKARKAIGVFAADVDSSTYWNDRITQEIFYQIVTCRKRRVGEILISAMKEMHEKFGDHDAFTKETYKMYRYLGDPDTVLTGPEDDGVLDVRQTSIDIRYKGLGRRHDFTRKIDFDFGKRIRRAYPVISGLQGKSSPMHPLPGGNVTTPMLSTFRARDVQINNTRLSATIDVSVSGEGLSMNSSIVIDVSLFALLDP